MFKLNKKGQASSTFQLLIAAIVALAILGVLISVIGGVNPLSGDAKTATSQKLKAQMNNPGAVDCTEPVTFKKGISLATEGITKDSGLDPQQVFFTNAIDSVTNFPEPSGTKSVLRYSGTSSKKVVLCIICSDNGKTGLETAITNNEISSFNDWPTSSGNYELPENGETACIVYPKKTA